MGKQPQMAHQGTRYKPYRNSNHRQASPPPDTWGIHAGSHHAQVSGGIFDLLKGLNMCYESCHLCKIFRNHVNQPGVLGQAIETWIQYDKVIIFLTSSFLQAAQTAVLLANLLLQIWESRMSEPPVSFLQGVKSLIVELNSHYRFSTLDSILSIQMARCLMSVCVVFASL